MPHFSSVRFVRAVREKGALVGGFGVTRLWQNRHDGDKCDNKHSSSSSSSSERSGRGARVCVCLTMKWIKEIIESFVHRVTCCWAAEAAAWRAAEINDALGANCCLIDSVDEHIHEAQLSSLMTSRRYRPHFMSHPYFAVVIIPGSTFYCWSTVIN